MAAHPDWSWATHVPDPDGAGVSGMHHAERHLVEVADLVTVPSEADLRKLVVRHESSTPIAVVPNAVPMAGTTPPEVASAPTQCAFTGALDYFPNALAALEIARQIGPAIREAAPGMRVVLAGRNPPPFVVAAVRDSPVELVANPADIAPFFRNAIQIVPLTLGGGTRLKILEAFAAGTSVISTDKGIEGIPAEPGVHYLRATAAVDFGEAVREILRDPAADLRRRRRGWDLAASGYSWDALQPAVDRVLDRLNPPEAR
jgi:glycosyltransferase involved in cell wall biosynthesis